jgi:serine/threonine-protein kinase
VADTSGETAPHHRYRELAPLAKGGMAVLVRAERDDGEEVVIKRICPPFDHDPVYRGLFADEGEVAAHLESNHIVRLLDRGEDDIGPYLVFEHVAGTDLGIVLERLFDEERPLELGAFFAVALPLLGALADAHAACGGDGSCLDVVHRDVSPGNVLLSNDGEVKLADFGVAASSLKTEHTVAGEMKGKFAYMSPEQTRGERVDARSDLFAAGIVLYECLLAGRLFDGPTDADVVQAVREERLPSLREGNPDVSPELEGFLQRLLARDPRARPESAAAAREELREIAASLFLDTGHKRHICRLARAHPRPDMEEHPHVQQLRRRTQRVLQSSPALTVRPARKSRLPLAAAAVAVIVVVATAITLRSENVTPPEPAEGEGDAPAEIVVAGDPPAEPPVATPAPDTTPDAKPDAPTMVPAKPPPDPAPTTVVAVTNQPDTVRAVEDKPIRRRRARPTSDGAKTPADKPAAAKGFGKLFLESDPWAHVSVDGEPLGQETPLLGLRLPAGLHVVTLSNPHFGITRTVKVRIEPGGTTRRFVDLTKR